MVAVLKPVPEITAQVAQHPQYDNRQIDNFADWYHANERALCRYFLSLPADQTDYDSFREFVHCQHDAQTVIVAAARETTYGRALREF